MTQSLICLMLLNLALSGATPTTQLTPKTASLLQTNPLPTIPIPTVAVPANASPTGLNTQAHQNYQAADSALDSAYLQLMTSLDTQRQAQLTQAHQAWLYFREVEAEFRAAVFDDGAIQPLIYAQALIELTEHRTSQLDALFQEQVGY